MQKTFAKWSFITILILFMGGVSNAGSGETIRQPVWAGKFYPAEAQALRRTIEKLTRQADLSPLKQTPGRRLKALILPHAGYRYSGLTAAHAGRVLKKLPVRKVIMLGPDHHVGFKNGAISTSVGWHTPLGKVALHPDCGRLLDRAPQFRYVAASDMREHSLEVLLPFLQFYMSDFKIVPIVLGPCAHHRIAQAIDPMLDENTLLVVSADLSHYLPYDRANQRDRDTINAILNLDSESILSEENRSCGKHPIGVLLHLARKYQWLPVLLNYLNSGDTAKDRHRVVGYAAIAFYGEKIMSSSEKLPAGLTQSQGQTLVALARSTLMSKFNLKISPKEQAQLEDGLRDNALQERNGIFVTLKKDGRLRGCIGSLVGKAPIVDSVRTNAVNAAFHDPRFRKLTNPELDRVYIEVSVLTEPQPLKYKDAEDLVSKLRPGVDGVTIQKGPAGATFLPQVWDQLPNPETFLSHLCAKAGISEEAWRQGELEVETYQVQHFAESR